MLKAKLFQFGEKVQALVDVRRDTELRREAAARRHVVEKMAKDAGANLKNRTHVAAAYRRVAVRFG
ncbi:MAG TPA: hypothetical protein VN397_01560 [Candidatus Methylomirabilis sp.]|nr:hypothetical protein [Candidatus Methylomirabilis sp.]